MLNVIRFLLHIAEMKASETQKNAVMLLYVIYYIHYIRGAVGVNFYFSVPGKCVSLETIIYTR